MKRTQRGLPWVPALATGMTAVAGWGKSGDFAEGCEPQRRCHNQFFRCEVREDA